VVISIENLLILLKSDHLDQSCLIEQSALTRAVWIGRKKATIDFVVYYDGWKIRAFDSWQYVKALRFPLTCSLRITGLSLSHHAEDLFKVNGLPFIATSRLSPCSRIQTQELDSFKGVGALSPRVLM
jgi:hypothetical protein